MFVRVRYHTVVTTANEENSTSEENSTNEEIFRPQMKKFPQMKKKGSTNEEK